MKVLALIYGDEARWEGLADNEREEVYDRYRAFAAVAAAKIVAGAELAPTSAATTVRVRDERDIVSDGPFAETKEALGGFFLLDCADLDEAAQVAAQIPGAATGTIELRAAQERAA